MPLINSSSQNDFLSNFADYDNQKMSDTSFGEVFSASLGLVIDEELSISRELNRQGWAERKARIDQLIKSGEVDAKQYRGSVSVASIDYERIAKDLNREDIKTDSKLTEERNAILKSRREYAEDVIARGSGMAQFLGAMNAYMLDPINILTVGLAAPATTAKGVSTIGRIAMASRNAALIEGATELGIQAMVYQHKQEIDSPYGASDALANIAMAATGAGVLSGVTEGLAGWIKAVRGYADQLPETEELATAKEYLQRQEMTLEGAPKVDLTLKRASEKTPYLYEVSPKLLQRTEEGADISKGFKGDAKAPITATQYGDELLILDGHHRALLAEEEGRTLKAIFIPEKDYISMLEKGVHPAEMRKEWMTTNPKMDAKSPIDESLHHKKQIESDTEYLIEMDRRSTEYARATKDQTTYQNLTPVSDVEPVKPPPATASQREREILRAQGLDETFDSEMARFDQLETKTLEIDGAAVDAEAMIKQFDDEIQGLDDVLKCAYGGAA